MNPSICERPLISNWCPLIHPTTTQLTHLQNHWYNSSYSFAKCCSSKSKSKSSSSSSSSAVVQAEAVAAQDDELQQSFVVSYLIDSCGLSRQRAVDVSHIYSRNLRFDSPEKPDSMLAFFRNNGFTDDDITELIRTNPVLLALSEEILLPKIQFFYSIGFTKEELPTFLAKSGLLKHSLKEYIIPLYSMLKEEVGCEREIIMCMKRLGFILRKGCYKNIRPNLALLREVGVPSSKLGLLVRSFPSDLLAHPDEFRGVVDEVKALGFDVTKSLFVVAIHAYSPRFKAVRDRSSKIFMEWGFSEKDTISAFMKWPQCLLLSENKLRDTMDFLIGKMGCQAEVLARIPVILNFDLDKRIIPRCSVLHVLTKKGLVRSNMSLSYILCVTEKSFLSRFVYKHTAITSLLLDVYERKVDPFKEP